jgi:tetratricopeptide (TPR) repeat protein
MEAEQTFLEQLVQAQGFYITGIFTLAKEKFTHILQTHPKNYEAFLYRGYTNLRLNHLEEALKDAEAAIAVNSNRYEGLLLKGRVLFHLGKFDEALNEIGRAKLVLYSFDETDPQRLEAQLWEQKVQSEKTKRGIIDPKNLSKKPEEHKVEKNGASVQHHHPQSGKVTYKWHQTDSRVYIDINFSLKKKEDLNIKIEKKRVEISFPVEPTRNFELNLDLFDEIEADNSLYNIHLDRIEIQLEKSIKERNWTFLENNDSQNERILETFLPKPVTTTQTQESHSGPAYPSSSKVKRDWSKIDKEIDQDMKKNKDDYVDEDPLNKFFKEIYSNADENTRKAMVKSFQTSGGTVLSTNWDEVKVKDYEKTDRPDAPQGQEWRKWDK